jgi:hypothetical protein
VPPPIVIVVVLGRVAEMRDEAPDSNDAGANGAHKKQFPHAPRPMETTRDLFSFSLESKGGLVIPSQFFGSLRHYPNVGGDLQMKDEPEEIERQRREYERMRKLLWATMRKILRAMSPLAIVFFVLWIVAYFWVLQE